MVVVGTHLNKFFGDVRGPAGRIMTRDCSLELLPGSDDSLLGFIFWFVRHSLAGILAVLYAGSCSSGRRRKLDDFVINQRAPSRGALHPDAQDVGFAAVHLNGADITVGSLFRFRVVSCSGAGQVLEELPFGLGLSLRIGPRKIRVE